MQQQVEQRFVIKSIIGNDILISGYASVYNIVDQQNDIIVKGAFSSINHSIVKFLWQHDATKPVGIVKALQEDEYGLLVDALIYGNTTMGQEVVHLVHSNVINGLSVGFNIQSAFQNKHGQRVITKAMLLEISVVTFPANAYAKIYQILTMSNNTNQIGEIMQLSHDQAVTDNKNVEYTDKINIKINKLEDKVNNLHSILSRPETGAIQDTVYKAAFNAYLRKGINDELVTKAGLSGGRDEGGVLLMPPRYIIKLLEKWSQDLLCDNYHQ